MSDIIEKLAKAQQDYDELPQRMKDQVDAAKQEYKRRREEEDATPATCQHCGWRFPCSGRRCIPCYGSYDTDGTL